MKVRMVALMDFNGDATEGLHLKGQEFLTTEGRAMKYGSHLPKLAARVTIIEEEFVKVTDKTPHLPKETKVVAPKAKKRAPAKKKASAKRKAPARKTARKR